MQIPRRINSEGKVAVLVTRGFGAGWSTWNREFAELLLFHKEIVEAVLNNDRLLAAVIARRLIDEIDSDECFYDGGRSGLEVEWVPQGARFEINEYDGSESLVLLENKHFFVA